MRLNYCILVKIIFLQIFLVYFNLTIKLITNIINQQITKTNNTCIMNMHEDK